MLLALLWLYYITFWPVSKTFFSTPLEVVARFFFAAFGGGERGERARTPRAPPRGCRPLQPCFHIRAMRRRGEGRKCEDTSRSSKGRLPLATPLSHQGDAADYRQR